jgi:hypothetical protein
MSTDLYLLFLSLLMPFQLWLLAVVLLLLPLLLPPLPLPLSREECGGFAGAVCGWR